MGRQWGGAAPQQPRRSLASLGRSTHERECGRERESEREREGSVARQRAGEVGAPMRCIDDRLEALEQLVRGRASRRKSTVPAVYLLLLEHTDQHVSRHASGSPYTPIGIR